MVSNDTDGQAKEILNILFSYVVIAYYLSPKL